MAALVEKTPLRWIGFQPRPVSSEIWDAEIIHAPLETLADLPVDFTKAGPAQVELGQCPLKEGCVLRIAQRSGRFCACASSRKWILLKDQCFDL